MKSGTLDGSGSSNWCPNLYVLTVRENNWVKVHTCNDESDKRSLEHMTTT